MQELGVCQLVQISQTPAYPRIRTLMKTSVSTEIKLDAMTYKSLPRKPMKDGDTASKPANLLFKNNEKIKETQSLKGEKGNKLDNKKKCLRCPHCPYETGNLFNFPRHNRFLQVFTRRKAEYPQRN